MENEEKMEMCWWREKWKCAAFGSAEKNASRNNIKHL